MDEKQLVWTHVRESGFKRDPCSCHTSFTLSASKSYNRCQQLLSICIPDTRIWRKMIEWKAQTNQIVTNTQSDSLYLYLPNIIIEVVEPNDRGQMSGS